MNYTDVDCDSGGGASNTKETIRQGVSDKQSRLGCVKDGTCVPETPVVEGCDEEEQYDDGSRRKRNADRNVLVVKFRLRRPFVGNQGMT